MVKISIIMGYYNRKHQLINTLKSIEKSSVSKEDYEIIVVDDGSDREHDISDIEEINLVKIPKEKKSWTCPVIAYNIAISKAKGEWIIIQNPEITHENDLLKFILDYGQSDTYYSVNVLSHEEGWYSHSVYRPCFYHFCTVIHRSKLALVGGFNNDMKNGIDYDDNEFLERVKRVCKKLKYINLLGIHQWHPKFSYMYSDTEVRRSNNKLIYENTIKDTTFIYSDPLKDIKIEDIIMKKRLLIFGGTGSLGHHLVKRYKDEYEIYIASRDETKQWDMKLNFPDLKFFICDVRDKFKVDYIISIVNPDVIIIASAMKHIDRCEEDIHECLQTNLLGTKNILESLNKKVETICFVSTDKACSPVNVYGMTKGISESLMIQYSLLDKSKKYVTVRYGNVLNSRGSIIPTLHKIGKDEKIKQFNLTHENMTRFIMTLDQSVDLIDHAINHAESGDIVIPELISMKVKDLVEIFSDLYNKPVSITGLRPGEKLLESLINETQSLRIRKGDKYTYIKPRQVFEDNLQVDYNSSLNQISKEELKQLLMNLNLI